MRVCVCVCESELIFKIVISITELTILELVYFFSYLMFYKTFLVFNLET